MAVCCMGLIAIWYCNIPFQLKCWYPYRGWVCITSNISPRKNGVVFQRSSEQRHNCLEVAAVTKGAAARGRRRLSRHFIVPSLLSYLYTLPNFVTKPFCRFINLTLSARRSSSYFLKYLHWCFQARGFTDSRLWVHFGVYIKINVEFYICRNGVDEVFVLGWDAVLLWCLVLDVPGQLKVSACLEPSTR